MHFIVARLLSIAMITDRPSRLKATSDKLANLLNTQRMNLSYASVHAPAALR